MVSLSETSIEDMPSIIEVWVMSALEFSSLVIISNYNNFCVGVKSLDDFCDIKQFVARKSDDDGTLVSS